MSQTFTIDGVSRHWRVSLLAGLVLLMAAVGTYVSGQYRIGKLDVLIDRYEAPVADFAATNAKARQGTIEADLLESCKQLQIGTWLQTTDALKFRDPISGNRIIVQLEAGRDYIDINGREISTCITDEIEDRQFDIGSMTSGWAVGLTVAGLILCALAFAGRRIQKKHIY